MRWLAGVCVCAIGGSGGCGADRDPKWRPAGHAAPRAGGTLRFAIPERVASLDPLFTQDEATAYATHAMFDTLLGFGGASGSAGDRLRLVPALAERWDVSADATTYTFTLRAGLAYSDGTPITAADVRATIDRNRAEPGAACSGPLADVTALETPDARTVTIHLAHGSVAFASVLTLVCTAPQPAGQPVDRRAPRATGPFEVARWDEGERLVLRRNPRYWDAAHVYLDALELREQVPRDTQLLMFERGELDVAARLAAPDALWLAEQPAWAPYVRRVATLTTFGSRMNVRVPPFTDRRVRQALNYALDKAHTLKLLQGAATSSHGVLPPGMLGRDDTLAPYPHDPARARALLAETGYGSGFDVDYLVMADDEALRLAASLQADLAEVGVRVHVRPAAFATYADELGRADGAPFAKAAWSFDYPDPADVFDAELGSRGIEAGTSFAFYATPELDALLDRARGERDPDARAALYRRAERIVYDDAPWLWDYHQDAVEVVQPYVVGGAPHPVWVRDYTHAWLDVGSDGQPVPR